MQENNDQPSMIMTAGTVAMIPTLILFGFLQKYFVAGSMAGAVKG